MKTTPKKTKTQKLTFVTSAASLAGCPADETPEVALAGRSNSGKSSFINGLAGGLIAKVSSVPGKTRLLNFFKVGPHYRLVDMPGYGYAARSGDEVKDWRGMIEPFLAARGNLAGLLLLMDIRRDWAEEEQMLLHWFAQRDLPVAVVLTKADKLSKSEVLLKQRKLREKIGLSAVFVTSSLKKTGFEEVEEFVFTEWIKPVL